MPATATRTVRIEARLRPVQKRRIERAAYLRGMSVSDFLVKTVDEAAIQAIEEERTWKLTEEDHKVFFEAMMNPPGPNAKLRAAAARFKKMFPQ